MAGCVVRWLAILWAVALAGFDSAPAIAGPGFAGTPLGACIARLAPGQDAAAMFARPAAFDCTTPQRDFGPGDYWVLSAPLPADAPAVPRIRIGSLWQQGLTLHVRYADGAVVTIPTTSATLGRRIQLGAIVEFAPPVRAAPVERLLWRVDGAANMRGILLGQRIAYPAASAEAALLMGAIYAGFAGLAIALLIYNLAIWTALRHRFQLAYCAMVAALLGYALSSSGVFAWIAPAIDNNDRIRLNYALLGIGAACAMAFARCFFEPRVFAGRVGTIVATAMVLLALSGLSFGVLSHIDPIVADRITSIGWLTAIAAVAPLLWSAWLRGSRYLWLFSIAWAAPIVFAVARILSSLGLYPTSFWLDNSTVLSMAFEALLSSLAIAYRVQMLSWERDDALAAEYQARQLADLDPLTGLLNRRAFLDSAIQRGAGQTLHLIDIDHFKAVNETLGHDGGDEVLRLFARTLRAASAPDSLIARLGGEEFAVVSDTAHAIEPERLLAQLRAARMPFDLTVTASLGSCTGPLASETDWKHLYRNADRALFDAKAAGRDRSRRAPARAIAA